MTKWLVRILLSVVVLFLAAFWQLFFSAAPRLVTWPSWIARESEGRASPAAR
jgi:hypothetical protein